MINFGGARGTYESVCEDEAFFFGGGEDSKKVRESIGVIHCVPLSPAKPLLWPSKVDIGEKMPRIPCQIGLTIQLEFKQHLVGTGFTRVSHAACEHKDTAHATHIKYKTKSQITEKTLA